LCALVAFLGLVTPHADADDAADERALYDATNADRANAGLGALSYDAAASGVARDWSRSMAASRTLAHNPNLAQQVDSRVTTQWTRLGENVAYGPSVAAIEQAFMNSSGHRANILGPYNRVGVGTARSSDGTLWATVVFIQGPAISSAPPPASQTPVAWYLRNPLSAGTADTSMVYGMSGDQVVACDWNGDGVDTPAVYRGGAFYLTNSLTTGVASVVFGFGAPGDRAVCGDWNADGKDTIGIYRSGVFYLRNSNTTGVADFTVGYGMPGDIPVTGDWNGDGKTTIGIVRSGAFYLRNSNTSGVADFSFGYGAPGDKPIVGDWNGDGKDTIAVFRQGMVYVRDTNTSGVANYAFPYGVPTDTPLSGDWNADRHDSVGVARIS